MEIVRFEYPPDDPDPNIPATRQGYVIMPAAQSSSSRDPVERLPLRLLPGPVPMPAGNPPLPVGPIEIDPEPEVTREVVDV